KLKIPENSDSSFSADHLCNLLVLYGYVGNTVNSGSLKTVTAGIGSPDIQFFHRVSYHGVYRKIFGYSFIVAQKQIGSQTRMILFKLTDITILTILNQRSAADYTFAKLMIIISPHLIGKIKII